MKQLSQLFILFISQSNSSDKCVGVVELPSCHDCSWLNPSFTTRYPGNNGLCWRSIWTSKFWCIVGIFWLIVRSTTNVAIDVVYSWWHASSSFWEYAVPAVGPIQYSVRMFYSVFFITCIVVRVWSVRGRFSISTTSLAGQHLEYFLFWDRFIIVNRAFHHCLI